MVLGATYERWTFLCRCVQILVPDVSEESMFTISGIVVETSGTGVSARMKKVPFKRISGFIAAGGMATLFHWAAMSGLVLLGMAPVAATFSGSVVGAVTNYWLQRTLAFPNARPHIQAIWRYAFSCSLAALLNVLIFLVLHQISVVPAQLLTTAAVAVFNYVVYQRLVFHEQTS